ncbi:MAG TPA: hypothetical protein PKV95_06520 [Anaerolineaceae bacterium]|jgi:hypothetical protein|nr:hypothetical protein [Anaerolineaceae bacterium]NMD31374.1 hypothetical protein [Chloroflexota bacterium]HNZ01457.1 hypothetical protein [Anaerolineaceae bacterium]HOD43742.1 hypothetical protein [Anaerolineaceae bacterium]HOH20248.1 hypothetical protein [Anaerolineaceae bacterium]
MASKALFGGLVIDEWEQPVEVTTVGGEAFYVVNDAGFRRHISSEEVDRQVLAEMLKMVDGNEEAIAEQTARLMGQDDLFTHAILINQIKQMGEQVDTLLEMGIPEETRSYLGMMGFRVVINLHGEVLDVRQPGAISDEGDGGE